MPRASELVRLDGVTGQKLATIRAGEEPRELVSTPSGLALTAVPAPTAHRGGTLTALFSAGWPSPGFPIDPDFTFAAFYFQWELFAMTNDGLVSFKRVPGPDGENVVPDLATSIPTPADGGLTYSFHMRSGVRYSDGHAVHAADIRYGLERVFRINRPPPGFIRPGTFYSDVVGAQSCTPKRCDLRRGIVVSGSRITFHLIRPDPYFLAKLAMPFAVAIAPGTPLQETGPHPVAATGPYQIVTNNSKQVVLVRNRYFHEWSPDAQPDGYPNKIIVRRASSTAAEVHEVEQGMADWMLDSPPLSALSQLEVRYPAQLHSALLAATRFAHLNITAPPFDSARARQGFAFAINRQHVANLVGGALSAQPTCQVIPPNFPGYRPYCPYTLHPTVAGTYDGPDLTTATKRVTSSGTRGTPVRVCVAKPGAGDAYASAVDAYLVQVLRRIGYKASADPRCGPGDAVSPGSWLLDYPGAADFLNLFGCPSIPPGCVFPWVTHRVAAAGAAQNRSSLDGLRAWTGLDHAVTDRAPWVPLTTDVATGLTARRVGNYEYAPTPGGGPWIDQMWVR
jgi:peptide/nickel transport system substrate-binding protein